MANERPLTDKEERLLSALAHGSVVIQGMGILTGVVLYVTQRNRSQRVAFQALQAAIYQFVGMLMIVSLWLIWGIVYGISFIPILQNPEAFEDSPPAFLFISLALMAIPMAVMVLWGLYGLLGALQSLRGREFRYLLIGKAISENLIARPVS